MDGNETVQLVSDLMAAAGNDHERRAVAELADAGLFEDKQFRRSCLTLREPKTMRWNGLLHQFSRFSWDDPQRIALERALMRIKLPHTQTPETLEELQVAIDLDQPDGLVLASWRDEYASDPRDPNPYHHLIDLCLDELRARSECWNCGRTSVGTTVDDLPVCSICKEN